MTADVRTTTKVPRALRSILALDDFERAGHRHLPRPIFGFVSGGAETNTALHGNRVAFDDYRFIPHVQAKTRGRSAAQERFGQRYAKPFGIPPMGASALAAYGGDVVLAEAAAATNIPFILSASSLIRMEEVVRVNPAAWFQAYLPAEEPRIRALLDRVGAAGIGIFVLTVDLPVPGNRESNIRGGLSMPLQPSLRLAWDGITHPRWLLGTAARTLRTTGMPHFENMDATRGPPILSRNLVRAVGRYDGLGWEHVSLIRRHWPGRFLVKGILAARMRDAGRQRGSTGS